MPLKKMTARKTTLTLPYRHPVRRTVRRQKRELPSIHYLHVHKIIMWMRKLSTSPLSSNKSDEGITSGGIFLLIVPASGSSTFGSSILKENVCANESNKLPHHSGIGFMKNIDQGLGSLRFGELWYRPRSCSTPTS